jgi:CRISPR/Cas system-associated exonuclease Cas4 (RecB family)
MVEIFICRQSILYRKELGVFKKIKKPIKPRKLEKKITEKTEP